MSVVYEMRLWSYSRPQPKSVAASEGLRALALQPEEWMSARALLLEFVQVLRLRSSYVNERPKALRTYGLRLAVRTSARLGVTLTTSAGCAPSGVMKPCEMLPVASTKKNRSS